jgi:hypothetical protein
VNVNLGDVKSSTLGVILGRTAPKPWGQTLFESVNQGAKLKLSWVASDQLLFRCEACDHLRTFEQKPSWNDITLKYDLSGR